VSTYVYMIMVHVYIHLKHLSGKLVFVKSYIANYDFTKILL